MFHNLLNHDSYLMMQELNKFNFKINVMLNGLEKYMSFTIINNLRFTDRFPLDILVKDLVITTCI